MNPPAAPLKIGQVHALLRREHPNLELSKIRYYEEMGLVAPARSRKGYRLYSEKDVACLREAIRLADEEFVPLRVIRVRLIEHGLLKDDHQVSAAPRQAARSAQAKVVSMTVPATAPRPTLVPPVDLDGSTDDETRASEAGDGLSVNQLLTASGVEPEIMNKIIALGLVTPDTRDGHHSYRRIDVAIVRAAAALLRDGADARLLGALRRVVERQVGILDDLTADLRGSSSTAHEVSAAKAEVARDVEILRAGLLERALEDFLNP
ncbi:MAG: MerR family transcriptional regulator [Acidobacteria bacterium]|nr:MerR family transcriptional regulator [Acidobacteriota bacterium]